MISFAAEKLMEMEVGAATGAAKSQVSRLCEEIDGKTCPRLDPRVKAFLERPIEGDWRSAPGLTCGSTRPT